MQKRTEKVFLTPKHKIIFMGVTCGLSILVVIILCILTLIGNDLVISNSAIFSYCTALYLLFVVFAMVIDEAIKKYPGLLVSIAVSIYSFCYIIICFIKGGQSTLGYSMVIGYIIYIGLSYLLYSKVYPIVAIKEKIKLFNTIYLMLVILITIAFGFIYSI